MSTEGSGEVGNVGGMGASSYARELAKRRVSATPVQTPVTPVTPVALSTPVLAAHIFADGNIMEDLQLAAELGKTLLERNKDLENAIKEQRFVIEDKTQEIEYLSKQTAALREVNDSRLRIYEQLEISIQELENSNQRLTSESNADKKKIKSLTATIDHLEVKCDELQKSLDDAKAFQQQQLKQQLQQEEDQKDRGRSISRRLQSPEEIFTRRSMSCENPSQCCEKLATECMELQIKIESIQVKLRTSQEEAKTETKKREDLEIEIECASQENAALREQIFVLKEKENNARSFEDELASVDDTSSSKICRKCMGLADETGSSITMQDFSEELEDMDISYEAMHGDCALVRLKNGGYAWGSQESLASMGAVVGCSISHESSPRTDASEAPNSLLSELDTQYRILIEKYEALLEAREQHQMHEKIQIQPPPSQTIIDSGIDELSGPMSLVMTDLSSGNAQNVSVLCQRCATCSCDLKLPTNRPSNIEEHSEVETSSSGFSEGETRFCSKMTQTEICEYLLINKDSDDAATPTPLGSSMAHLNLQTPMNPCESRFQTAPIYRRIFHEIFEVLKKDVDKERIEVDIIKIYDSEKDYMEDISAENKSANNKNKTEDSSLRDENEENKNPNVRNKEVEKKEKTKEIKVIPNEKYHKEEPKPTRPDFLDLDSSSRCSSRSRRRKRSNKHRQNNSLQQDTELEKGKVDSEPSSDTVNQEKLEPSTLVNTPAIIPSLPNVSSVPPKESKSKETQGPASEGKQRCEHKRRKSKRQTKSHQTLQNKLLSKVLNQNQATPNPRYQPSAWSHSVATGPQNLPSVQVAKLIKFERTYAEVLKSRRS